MLSFRQLRDNFGKLCSGTSFVASAKGKAVVGDKTDIDGMMPLLFAGHLGIKLTVLTDEIRVDILDGPLPCQLFSVFHDALTSPGLGRR